MGLCRVARVAAFTDHGAHYDPIAAGHPQRPPPQVRHQHADPVGAADHHVVAQDPERAEQLAHAFDQQVQQRDGRGAAEMVARATVGANDLAAHRRENGPAEAGELTRSSSYGPRAETGRDPSAGSYTRSTA